MKNLRPVMAAGLGLPLLAFSLLFCAGCAEVRPSVVTTPAGDLPATALPHLSKPASLTRGQMFDILFEMVRLRWHYSSHFMGGTEPLPSRHLLRNLWRTSKTAHALYLLPGRFVLRRRIGKPTFANRHVRVSLPAGWKCSYDVRSTTYTPYGFSLHIKPGAGLHIPGFNAGFVGVSSYGATRRTRADWRRFCRRADITPETSLAAILAAQNTTPLNLYKDLGVKPPWRKKVAAALVKTFLRLDFKIMWRTYPGCVAVSKSFTAVILRYMHPSKSSSEDWALLYSHSGKPIVSVWLGFRPPVPFATRLREELVLLSGLTILPTKGERPRPNPCDKHKAKRSNGMHHPVPGK
jgi:hypothetical protein